MDRFTLSHALVAFSLMLATTAISIDYNRCDDLCRVLGHEAGGQCSSELPGHCICQPDDVDVTEYLPSVCEH